MNCFNPIRPRVFDALARLREGADSAPLCNLCSAHPRALQFGMCIVHHVTNKIVKSILEMSRDLSMTSSYLLTKLNKSDIWSLSSVSGRLNSAALDCYDDVYIVVCILSRIVIFWFMYSSVP